MKVIAVAGSSGSGKTRLIESLAVEFKKRNARLAVVKHCPHGFDLDDEGKDSRKYMRAGAVAAALVGPRGRMVIRRGSRTPDVLRTASDFFLEADVVLVEGGSLTPGLKKIEVLRPGVKAKPVGPAADVAGYVSDGPLKVKKPVFRPSAVARIADFIEKEALVLGPDLRLEVDGRDVPLEGFARKIMTNVLLSLVLSLHGVGPQPRHISLAWKRNGQGAQDA
jgi:molybdopterin-guanine dinucleotide biosynthesis protein B